MEIDGDGFSLNLTPTTIDHLGNFPVLITSTDSTSEISTKESTVIFVVNMEVTLELILVLTSEGEE